MAVSYVAQTREHLLMLDDDGICLYVHRRRRDGDGGIDEAADGAIACIGAQYVASLDAQRPGVLADEPLPGRPMLFAKENSSGRICLVRTGPIERFEARGSGFHAATMLLAEADADPDPNDKTVVYLEDDCLEEDEETMHFRRPSRGGPIRVRMVGSR